MARRKSGRHPVTVQATLEQLWRWEDAGRVYKRDVPTFLAFAGDYLARYLRELNRERSRPNPILFRREEKRLLEALVRSAKESARYLPKPFTTPHFCQRKDPAGDLKRAVYAVEDFWERHGEAYGI